MGATWVQKSFEFLTKNERALFDFLREGPKRYSEIVNHLNQKGIKKRTANNLLNRKVKDGKVFRIEKDGNAFYRYNDFPANIKALFCYLDSLPRKKSVDTENMLNEENFQEMIQQTVDETFLQMFVEKLKENFILLYPKLSSEAIFKLTLAEFKSVVLDPGTHNFLQRLKKLL